MADHEFQHAEDDLPLEALRELVTEIEAGDWRDRNGVGLLNNIAYLKAAALLDLYDTLGTRGATRG